MSSVPGVMKMGLEGDSNHKLDQRLETAQQNTLLAQYQAAIICREAGCYQESAAWLRDWLSKHPEDAVAHAMLSQVLLLDKQDDAASVAIERALALAPALPIVQRNHARFLLKRQTMAALQAAQVAYQGDPQNPESWLVLAAALGANKLDDQALPLVERALQSCPDYAEAYANRAMLKLRGNDLTAALVDLEKALTIKPHLGWLWGMVGTLRYQFRNLSGAIEALQKALEYEPGNVGHMVNLGEYLRQNYQVDAAIALLEKASAMAPDNYGVWVNLGTALQEADRIDEAKTAYARALEINPQSAEISSNLGALEKDEGNWEEALRHFDQALAINPDHAAILTNRAIALSALERHEEAEAAALRAIALNSTHMEAQLTLSGALSGRKQHEQAWEILQQALQRSPENDDTLQAIASHHAKQEQWAEAEDWARRALTVRPKKAGNHAALANILETQGSFAEAEICYRQARELDPGTTQYAYRAELLLPIINPSQEAITYWRRRYQEGIGKLMALPPELDNPVKKVSRGAFDLAYHNADDRPLKEALCQLFRAKSTALNYIAPHIGSWRPPATGHRLRIGFCSQFLAGHTIGKLYQGMLRHLDRARFEVVLMHAPGAKHDAFSAQIDQLADKVVQLSGGLAAQQQAVAAEALDVLFYPDIGMSPATYFLAYARLAPVQVLGWGHPDTSGLNTLDYFVSAHAIEPEDADSHYSERLIRLSRLPCFYQPLAISTQIPQRAALGLPDTGTLYGCPQSLFKFHPDFDAVLAEIADGDPDGHIVVLDGAVAPWSSLLRERWAASYPILNQRVIFLPRQPLDRFMALMAHFDVLLDPIHFGSGNTLYEAMVYGTPIVTWPGRFMRGRIVAGAYQQMNLADAPVAVRLEDYAPLALALGRDAERRKVLRTAFMQGAQALFADLRAVREFEAFLEAAVRAAGHGEKLPPGWRPAIGDGAV